MQMNNNVIGFILIAVLLSGCLQNSEMDKMTNKEIEQYFLKHKKELKHLVNICKKNPAIQRVEKDKALFYVEKPSKKEQKAAKEAEGIIKQLKIDNMQCERNEMIINNKLMGASFIVYSAGLGVSGEGQYIRYDTKNFLDSLPNHKKANIPWRTISPLPKEGWTIVYTK